MGMNAVRFLPVMGLVLLSCVSTKTVNDLRLIPLTPVDADAMIWNQATIKWVMPFTPCGAAGLAVGDRLISWNGTPVRNVGEANDLLSAPHQGPDVSVAFTRAGQAKSALLHGLRASQDVGCGVYPWASTYSVEGFPGLPGQVNFLEFGGAKLSVFATYFSDQPGIVVLRLQIDNVQSGMMEGPKRVEIADADNSLFQRLSPGQAVGYLLPSLGSQQPYAPYLPYKPPVYVVSQDRTRLYPQNDPYTALANTITAFANVVTAINNARTVNREANRAKLYEQLSADYMQFYSIPASGRTSGILIYRGSNRRPIKVMVFIENQWHQLLFR